MTPTHKERLLADILAALLRIEALMQREKVADVNVDVDADAVPVQPPPVLIATPFPVPLPGMPDPPIAPVRPQTVWSVNKANAPSLNQGRGWIHATGFSMVGP